MSYDLDFWKYKDGICLDHQDVYERLSNGEEVDGLETLPIPEMLGAVEREFSTDWMHDDEETWESDDRGCFQTFTTAQFFRVDCYGMEDGDMNRLINVALSFGCPLYDPQAGKRYDG
ncbi:hypothetical protein [uncultured Paludibaculum sp.]|uniref:hypothetical protein n=1 Tax=uncultured Paludibaculum sp. TaxID=1765020 RepID=UPI002AAB84FB|nr:hypothetical protein [uncultured Paludibaculum sp.]